MPYYLHDANEPPEAGCHAHARATLVAWQTNYPQSYPAAHIITFVMTPDDTYNWTYRERDRMTSGEYLPLPWPDALTIVCNGCGEVSCTPRCDKHDYPTYAAMGALRTAIGTSEEDSQRFAHLALKFPGQIAFTASPEHGYNDRQTTLRPGKYLERFFPGLLTIRQRDRFIAAIAIATKKPELTIATSRADIKTMFNAYRSGWGSCMQRKSQAVYDWQKRMDNGHTAIHPCEVYADSDLAVAYLGPIDAITARVVVWPATKRYSTFYGDSAKLRTLLELHGYSAGTMNGAHIQAITCENGALAMPYIDNANGAELINGRLLLGSGSIETQCLAGYTGEADRDEDDDDDETGDCGHCGDTTDQSELDDHSGLCSSCYDQYSSCSHCSDTIWTDEDEYTSTDDGALCSSCASDATKECVVNGCDREWIEECLEYAERRRRRNNGMRDAGVCTHCEEDASHCGECDIWSTDGTCECEPDDSETPTDETGTV